MEEQIGIYVMQEVNYRQMSKYIMFRTQFSLWEMDDVNVKCEKKRKNVVLDSTCSISMNFQFFYKNIFPVLFSELCYIMALRNWHI